jgi:hypothetical protein
MPEPTGNIQETLVASASRTASGESAAFQNRHGSKAIFVLDVSAASGTTPTLDVDVVGVDHEGNEYTLKSFTQAIAVTNEAIYFGLSGDTVLLFLNLKVKWTLGGTSPNFTFSVSRVDIVD